MAAAPPQGCRVINERGAIGSGNTAPDWEITGDATANLRAERSGKNKAGRIYTIVI